MLYLKKFYFSGRNTLSLGAEMKAAKRTCPEGVVHFMEKVKENLVKEKSEIQEKRERNEFNLNLEEMLEAGLHFGHQTTKGHPKMAPYIQGAKNSIHIIDLNKAREKFEEALRFIKELIIQEKVLFFVGTKIQAKKIIKEVAKECGFPYVTERWLGGTFSNFDVMKKRVDYWKELERKRDSGELEKYTKKERLEIEDEMKKLDMKFTGIKNMERLPDAIFIIDMENEKIAVREARMKGITVIGICDTNVDPRLADYPIPASDDAMSSIRYILEKVKEVVLKTKEESKRKK